MSRTKGLFAALLLPLFFSGLDSGAPQSQALTETARFKVQSASVLVDVIVTDSKGNVVPGLTAGDFKVFENEVQQQIAGFEAPPGSAAAAGASAAIQGKPDGSRTHNLRLITLVMDLGDMQAASLQQSIKAATQYVEKVLGADDFAAVYAIGRGLSLVVPFTKDKSRVIQGIESLSKRATDGPSTVQDRIRTRNEMDRLRQDEVVQLQGDPLMGPAMAEMIRSERLTLQSSLWMQTSFQARAVFVALRAIAQASSALPGRKNVVVFSEGFGHSSESAAEASAVIDSANRANVAIYIIDPAGLTSSRQQGSVRAESESSLGPPAQGSRGRQRLPDTPSSEIVDLARRGPEVHGGYSNFEIAQQIGLADEHDDMKSLADATGGFLVKDRNALLPALERIDRDLREYYTLSYQPRNDNYDGTFRKIRVALNGRGYHVRYRKGYWALSPGDAVDLTPASAQLLASAVSGSLKPAFTPKVNAMLLLGPNGDLAVPFTVWLPGDPGWATKSGKGYSSAITLLVTARDAQGRLLGAHQRFLDLQWNKDEWSEVQQKGLQFRSSLAVPRLEPVTLQVIFQFSNGAAALGELKVAIPGAQESGARLTSLLLTGRVDAAKPSGDVATDVLRVQDFQLVLPTRPEFAASDKLTLYFGIDAVAMDPQTGSPRLGLALAIKSGEKAVRDLPWEDSLYPYPQSTNRLFFLRQYELTGLVPGQYTVEATLRDLAKNTTTVQSAEFYVQ